jgi:hypothetical protein
MKRKVVMPLVAMGLIVGGELVLAGSSKSTSQDAALLDPFQPSTSTASGTISATDSQTITILDSSNANPGAPGQNKPPKSPKKPPKPPAP